MKRRYLDDELDSEFVINLSDIPESQMTLTDFKRMAVRNKLYLTYRSQSGLDQETWCYALNITKGRDDSYVSCQTEVPNIVLNNASMVYKKVKHAIQYCRKVIINAKAREL
jgi:hypothetical protein